MSFRSHVDGEQGWLQRTAVSLTMFKPFEVVVVLVILANLYTIALDSPKFHSTATDEDKLFLARWNSIFLSVFTIELVIRACAVAGRLSPLQLFEAAIVITSWVIVLFPGLAVFNSAVRCFRVLRVLMLFDEVEGMHALCEAALWSIPSLLNVGGLCSFTMGVMAVIGVQLFEGTLHHRCAHAHTGADSGAFCGGVGATCADGFECRRFEGNGDHFHFDSVPAAMVPLVSTFLLDGWAETMYVFMRASSWQTSIYFVSLAVVGGFFVLQLFPSVVSEAFHSYEKRRREALVAVMVAEQGEPQGDSLYDASAADAEDEASSAASQGDRQEAYQPLLATRSSSSSQSDTLLSIPSSGANAHQGRLNAALAAAKRGAQQARERAHKADLDAELEVLGPHGRMCARICARVVSSNWFARGALLAVFVNVVVACMPFHGEPSWYRGLYELLSEGLTALFAAEMGLKLLGLGATRYWANAYNAVDGSLVLLSMAELVLVRIERPPTSPVDVPQILRLLRLVRLVRALRLLRSSKSMYRVMLTILKAMPQVRNLVLLTSCVMFIFAIIGMQLFGDTQLTSQSRSHFETFGPAMLSVLGIFSLGCVHLAKACAEQLGVFPTLVFFVPALFVGYFGIMNLFVAILVTAFAESVEEADTVGSASLQGQTNVHAASNAKDEVHGVKAESRPQGPARRTPVGNHAVAWLVETDAFEKVITLFVLASCVCLMLDTPRLDPSSELADVLMQANFGFTAIFTIEAILKMHAYGARNYFAYSWNVVDFVIVCASLLSLLSSMVPSLATCRSQASFCAEADLRMLRVLRIFRVLRLLRPLRLLVLDPGMKAVIETLLQTLPAVQSILTLGLAIQLLFAVVGMRLFSGTFGSCTNPSLTTKALCDAAAAAADAVADAAHADKLGVPLSGRTLRSDGSSKGNGNSNTAIAWRNPPAGSFDSFGSAMLALFTATTGDNMPDLMYVGMDAKGVDVATARTEWSPAAFYFILWMLIGTCIAGNLFVGAITVKFSELRHELDGMHPLMTPAQREWVTLIRGVRTITATRRPRPPCLLRPLRLWSYRIAMSRRFEYLMYGIIMLNMLVLAADHYGMEDEEVFYTTYVWLTAAFRYAYIGEFAIKLCGLGPGGYCMSGYRQLELVLLVATVAEQSFTSTLLPPMVLRLLRIFRVLRVLRLLNTGIAAGLRDLLIKLLLSAPAITNVLSVLVLIMFIYAIFGINLFCFVKPGKPNEFANFHSVPNAFLLLFQVCPASSCPSLPLLRCLHPNPLPFRCLSPYPPYPPCRSLLPLHVPTTFPAAPDAAPLSASSLALSLSPPTSFIHVPLCLFLCRSVLPWPSGPNGRRLARPYARNDGRRGARLQAGRWHLHRRPKQLRLVARDAVLHLFCAPEQLCRPQPHARHRAREVPVGLATPRGARGARQASPAAARFVRGRGRVL
jgi:hypothetical protein